MNKRPSAQRLISLVCIGLLGGSLSVAAVTALTGCPKAIDTVVKDGPDIVAATACVEQHWGEPVSQMAKDCTGQDEQLAIDLISGLEVLLQKRGAQPTPAYRADARVGTKVLAALAPDAGR
jgi:hypothetical protein